MKITYYVDLTEKQLDDYQALVNDSCPEGQFFWIENGEVFAGSNSLRTLWEQCNEQEIEKGKISLIL